MSVWALLVAAGSGERLGEERPKAFVGLGDLPLLAEPLRRLDESSWVDAIVVAVPHGWEEPAILLAEELSASKVVAVVAPWKASPVADGRLHAKQRVSDAPAARVRSPLWPPWAGLPKAAPLRAAGPKRAVTLGHAPAETVSDNCPRRAFPSAFVLELVMA